MSESEVNWAGVDHPPQFGDPLSAQGFGVLPAPAQDPPMINYRPKTLHQPFDMRARMRLSREKPMLGAYLAAFPHVDTARVMGQAGYDFIFVDWEHTPYTIESVVQIIRMIQYAGEGNTAVIVRVPSHDHHHIAWVLDAGASAVILPHAETVEQAKAAVKNCRYPKYGGIRSLPPNALIPGYNDGGGGWFDVFNRAAIILQIESQVGADKVDEIAAVEGIDGLMLGPMRSPALGPKSWADADFESLDDLAADLGVNGFEAFTNDKWLSCASRVTNAAKKNNLAALFPGFFPVLQPQLDMGFTMIIVSNDGILLAKGLRNDLNAANKALVEFKEKKEKEEI